MSQQFLTESQERAKRRIAYRDSSLDTGQSSQQRQVPPLQLQQKLGNRRVSSLIQAKQLVSKGNVMVIQLKLSVGAADDPYEREAERVAREVVNEPDPKAAKSFPIQAKSAGSVSDTFYVGDDFESRITESKGLGSPMPNPVREYMEPRFGVDFGHVRVHTGNEAVQMNQAVGAQAFTHGSDIYYGSGQSPTNLELTAHELAHVVQQTGAIPLQATRLDTGGSATAGPTVQRTCAACAAGGQLCPKCQAEGKERVQRNAKNPVDFSGASVSNNRHRRDQVHPAHGTAIAPNREFPQPAAAPEVALSNITARQATGSQGAFAVSEPSDWSEQEARWVAARAITSPPVETHTASNDDFSGSTRLAPRETTTSAPCAQCSAKKWSGGLAGGGSPLPADTRMEMENVFGTDLSAVRVHDNSGAAQMTRSLKAQAFTYGNDIFFDHGKYDPDSVHGKQLLAHEITHTIQQRNAGAMLSREGEGRTTLQCVNENLSSAGVAAWLLAIVGTTCGLIGALAGSPTGPGAAGTAALAAATCIAGVVGFSVGFVLGIITGCLEDPNFRSAGANPR